MNTWIDASYAVHPDMKSHTGGAVSFGTGAALSKSSKQKLNTRSSTEAELVGASVTICHFQSGQKNCGGSSQGYKMTENVPLAFKK
jgi:hypothetical protein